MKICGVELTGSDAVVCLLNHDQGQFNLPDCRVRKLGLNRAYSRREFQQFQFGFSKLMKDYSIDKVFIKERMTKGKFAGGAVSFKLEAAIQLIDHLDVSLLTPAKIKAALSEHPIPVLFSETGLKVFQEAAFTVAYVGHMSHKA
ncbi:MAG: DUF3010 family protein [Pseudomonadales bacterium]|nr:DUF3010 family protein [Pseudomonadales bacterium]